MLSVAQVVVQLVLACSQIDSALSLMQTSSLWKIQQRLGKSTDVKFFVYNIDDFEPRFNGNLKDCDRKGADYSFLEKILDHPSRVHEYDPDKVDVVIVPCLFESFRRCTTTNHAEKPPSLLLKQTLDQWQPNPHPEDVEEVPWTKIMDTDSEKCLNKVMHSKVYNAKSGQDHFWVVADWAMQFGITSAAQTFKNMSIGRIEIVDDLEAKIDHREEAVKQSRCSVVVPYASDVAYQVDLTKTPTYADWAKRKNLVSFRFEDRQYTFFCKNRPVTDERACPDAYDATPLRKQSLTFQDKVTSQTSVAMERVEIDQYIAEIEDSKFCLVIRGDTPSTHGLYDALAGGCIPILISDRFNDVAAPMGYGFKGTIGDGMNLDSFIIRLPEDKWMKDLDSFASELEAMDETRTRTLFQNMVDHRPKLLWSMPGHEIADVVLSSAARCAK